MDLVTHGSNWDQAIQLGQAIERDGASIINAGIGWHEARVPTNAISLPRANFTWVTWKIKPHLNLPLRTSNRINTPKVADSIVAANQSDLVSMARPFLT